MSLLNSFLGSIRTSCSWTLVGYWLLVVVFADIIVIVTICLALAVNPCCGVEEEWVSLDGLSEPPKDPTTPKGQQSF